MMGVMTQHNEQLTLLDTLPGTRPGTRQAANLQSVQVVSTRFQLSRSTRERGLRHVAEIRQMLAERSTAKAA